MRIHAVAGLHRRLYTSEDVQAVRIDTYLNSLIEDIRTSMTANGQAHRIVLNSDVLDVGPDTAVSIGVVVSELITNALKYAYPDRIDGEVRISFKADANASRLVVEDDGVGGAEILQPKGTGLGTRVIKAMLQKIGGEVTRDANHRGTRVIVTFKSAPRF